MDRVGHEHPRAWQSAARRRHASDHQATGVSAGRLEGHRAGTGPRIHVEERVPWFVGLRHAHRRSHEHAARTSPFACATKAAIGRLLARMTSNITNRYLGMEAAGLKKRSEERERKDLRRIDAV